MRFYIFAVFYLMAFVLRAQIYEKPKEAFETKLMKGTAVLASGEQIEGEINVRMIVLNFLNIKMEKQVLNLDPVKVEQFVYTDKKEHRRRFYSLDGISIPEYKPGDNHAFYEVIYESDNYAVLGYHKAELNRVNDPFDDTFQEHLFARPRYYEKAEFEEIVFVLQKSGEVQPFLKIVNLDLFDLGIGRKSKRLNRKIIEELYPNKKDQILAHMRENGLSIRKKKEIPAIFTYADSL